MKRRCFSVLAGIGAPFATLATVRDPASHRRAGRLAVALRSGAPAYHAAMKLPFDPPIEPMLAKAADALPGGDGWLYEPKWDGFRALVFKDRDRIYTQSRDLRPLDRYFPELAAAFVANLPSRCVLDGEIVIAGERGLDFDLLQLRLHP